MAFEETFTMNIIILLAGYGTRLRPHTYTRPKPLVTVAGKPVLGHIMDGIANVTIDKIAFVVGYLGDQFEPYIQKHYPHIKADYIEQKVANGQATAVLLAKDAVSGPTALIFGDTVTDVDLSRLANSDADGVIFVREVEDPRRFGVVQLDDAGYITKLIEKPATMENRLALIGAYYVRDAARLMAACQELVDRDIKTKGEYYLADALNLMIERGAKLRTERADVWLDCGKPDAVLDTNRYLLAHGRDTGPAPDGASFVVVHPVNVHPTAKIENSVIGPNASIGENCVIRNSVIRESIVDAGAQVTDHVLAHSLIGRDAVLIGRSRKFNVGDSSVVGFDEE
jgi:glucose-1-phosphate thymidylyltransferase